MSAVNFPDSPIDGEIFTNPNNGFTLQYIAGTGWVQYTAAITQPPFSGTPTGIFVGSEPVNPIPGIVWFPTGPGTFGIGYIWDGGEWIVINAGRVNSGLIGERPSGPTTGDLFFNTGTQIMELWNGLAWVGVPTTVDAVDVTFTSGTGLVSGDVKAAIDEIDEKVNNLGTSLVYGGTYNASTNLVSSVTAGGTTAGLVIGSSLPSSAPNTFVIVTVDGTGTAPAPTTALVAGNWLVNNGTSWDLLQFGDPVTSANLVTFIPAAGVSSTDVQAAIEELDSEKANKSINIQAGTGLVGGGDLSSNSTISLENTPVSSGSYGGQDKTVIIDVDPQGRLNSASQVNLQPATTFQAGIVQLDNSTVSTSETTAPTSKALSDTKAVADAALAQSGVNDGDVGDLTTLITTDKSTIVNAINEVQTETNAAQVTANQGILDAGTAQTTANAANAKANTNETNIGTLTNLTTTDQSSVVNAINEIDSDKIEATRQIISGVGLTGGGDLSADRTLSLDVSGATAGTYGSGVLIPQVQVDAYGRVTNISELSTPPPSSSIQTATDFSLRPASGIPYNTWDSTNTPAAGEWHINNSFFYLPKIDSNGVDQSSNFRALDGTTSLTITQGGTDYVITNATLFSDQLDDTYQRALITSGPSTGGVIATIDSTITKSGGITIACPSFSVLLLPLADGDIIRWNSTDSLFKPALLPDINVTESNLIYVDSTFGNDTTGVVGEISSPYATISAALAAAASTETIVVSEGTYNEANPLNVPAGVKIVSKVGANGYTNTFVTPTIVLEDVFVLLGDGSAISGLSVETPTAANKAAIRYTGGAGTTASATFIGIRGTAAGVGDGIVVSSTSSGKIISYEIRYQGLNMGDLMKVEGGILATESVHVPNTALGGGPNHVFSNAPTLGSPICRLQCIATNSGNSNVGYVAEIAGGTSVFYGVNWFNAANGIHLTSNDYDVEVGSGLIDCGSSVVVDAGLTGVNGRLVISAFMNNSFSYPNTWSNSDFVFEFLTKENDPNVPSKAKVIRGADLTVGSTTKPNGATFGRGPVHKQQIVVLTSDNAASAGSDGNNITDVTVAVLSKDSSTFSFQGIAANHCIYFGTEELDSTSAYVKHYGLDIEVLTGDSRDGKYVFEYWSGAAWVEIGSQSVSSAEGYSYSSDHFWRDSSKEKIFYGIRPSTPISIKEIGGITAYWVRARISVAPTALPQFEQCFLIPQSSLEINNEGIITKLGAAQTAVVTSQGSNIFSENGNVTNFIFTMGDGANAYSHNINNVLLNQVGEGLYWQTAITQGVCTALPIYVELGYSLNNTTATTPAEFDIYLQKIRTSGTLVADSTGGLLPVQRPEAETTPFTGVGAENPTLLANQPLPYQDANKLHRVRFGPFSIDQFYEGDALALSLEVANLGTPISDISIWGVAIIGYQWTDGIRGF